MISYLQIENLTKSFGDRILFENISLGIGEGDRIGLIAKNGAGKTTLLNILAGKENYDSGNIVFRNNLRVGYLEQSPSYPPELTVMQACFQSDNDTVRLIAEYEQALQIDDPIGLQELLDRMDHYKAVSREIHAIFARYTDLIEPISIDEAFLDVTHNKKGIILGVEVAKEIKKAIRTELNLVASAGVSYNNFLAKVASDWRKPDGLCTIHPDQALTFIDHLKVEHLWGVGPVTAKRMHAEMKKLQKEKSSPTERKTATNRNAEQTK